MNSKGMMIEAKEREAGDNYAIMKKHGYHRPSSTDRKAIRETFANIGITIYGVGYDLIDSETKQWIDNDQLAENIDSVILYELKTTNRKDIDTDFANFSYGISVNEIRNSIELGDNFKLIYLHFRTETIKILPFEPPITGIIGFQCVEGRGKEIDIECIKKCIDFI